MNQIPDNKPIVLKYTRNVSIPLKVLVEQFKPKGYSIRVKRLKDMSWEVVDYKEFEM